jgi:predicted RNA-binding protein with PIN domain
MPYIIDGNNVMGQTPGWHRDRPRARRALLDKLAYFARARKARITVVFDGAPDRDFPEGSAFKGVRVLYADQGSDADTRIERLVESSSDPRGLIVVTSDRRLSFAVRSSKAGTIRSGEFRRELEKVVSNQHPEEVKDLEVSDVKGWMRYFGEEGED